MKTWIRAGLITVLIAGFCFSAGCQEDQKQTGETMKMETAQKPMMQKPAAAEETEPTVPVNPVVKMTTTLGVIQIELYPEKAPKTVENFLQYVDDGFYNGTIFHRVINGFMIQGGGFTQDLRQKKTREPIRNECGPDLRNLRGTIAMARTNAPDSATCQFFINHVDNRSLDFDGPYTPGYAVFGKVIEGMDVVDAIARVPVTRRGPGMMNVPVQPVVIESVERMQ